MLDKFFLQSRTSHKDHFVSGCLQLFSSFPLASCYSQPLCAMPRIQAEGKSKDQVWFFTRQAGARPLATQNTQPEDTGIQLLPSSLQEHAVQKPQTHDSEHIPTKKLWDDPLSPPSTGNLKLHSLLLLDISLSLCKLKSIQSNCALLSVLSIFRAVSCFSSHAVLE